MLMEAIESIIFLFCKFFKKSAFPFLKYEFIRKSRSKIFMIIEKLSLEHPINNELKMMIAVLRLEVKSSEIQ